MPDNVTKATDPSAAIWDELTDGHALRCGEVGSVGVLQRPPGLASCRSASTRVRTGPNRAKPGICPQYPQVIRTSVCRNEPGRGDKALCATGH